MRLSEVLAKPYWPRKIELKATTVRLDRAVSALQQKYGIAKPSTNPKELTEKLIDFDGRLRRNDWSRFPWHMASDVFRSFFTSEQLDDPRWSKVAKVLLDTLEDTDRKNFCRAALDAYVLTYDRDGPLLDRLRNVLGRKRVEDIPVRRELVEDFEFFNPKTAHSLIGQKLAKYDRPYELLKSWGVWSPHATGLFENAFAEMLNVSATDLLALDRTAFDRVMNWLHPNSSTKAVAARAMGIDAIVLPLGDDRTSDLRDDVEKFLIGAFGDPRVTPAEWAGVSDRTLKIMYRWMTSKSLKIFFDIISKFEGSHMWEPRRKFWTAIDERKWIDDAWVVLNNNGAEYARSLAREHEDKTFLSHGNLNFFEREKCFFIMKVGDLTIVEGTHNFKVRIFDRNTDNAPRLRSKFYDKNEIHARPLPGDGEEYIHDVYENWMRKAEDYIRRNR